MFAGEERQQVVDLCVTLSRQGYLAATGGNVSLRVDAGHFAVTPSGGDLYRPAVAIDSEISRAISLDLSAQVEGKRDFERRRGQSRQGTPLD